MRVTPIAAIQGSELRSPLAGQRVRTRGVVTGRSRKGFFLQDPDARWNGTSSCGIFVFSPRNKPEVGLWVELEGEVVDYVPSENERPTTQIALDDFARLDRRDADLDPVWLTAENMPSDRDALARYLNSLEGMLVGVEKGATFVAPSNPFGDYVVLPPGTSVQRTPAGGVLIDAENPERWFPSFRIIDYGRAPQLNVGATLLTPVVGPLNYRASAYQIAALGRVRVRNVDVPEAKTRFERGKGHVTVLTLNGFNLDVRRENPELVHDPERDVDDDLDDGRFRMLARAIVRQAGAPDIVALQEMQDDDGAEISDVVSARRNYAQLTRDVRRLGGPAYRWAEIAPESGADGGQPGGNIRNAFLYDPDRVALVEGSLRRLGQDDEAFRESRKPLMARFRTRASGAEIVVINVHLASKRHQRGPFAPERPGFDPRHEIRVQQAKIIRDTLQALADRGVVTYVTGDFNDFEFSETLRVLEGDDHVNLVETLPEDDRYDYNHRGVSQVLMHGVVPKAYAERCRPEYEILHGNELLGAKPGHLGDKATDHAYVIARLPLSRA